jgi:hypothetical protein
MKKVLQGHVIHRQAAEERLAAVIQRQFGGRADKLMELLGETPDLGNIPESFWSGIGDDLRAAIEPELAAIAREAGGNLQKQVTGAAGKSVAKVDWKLANQAAGSWSKNYTFDLVKDLTANSRKALQGAVENYFANGQSLDDLAKAIEDLFGPSRSALIAITETTRAAAEGDRAIVAEVEKGSSLSMKPIFHTELDETVCDECAPHDGEVISSDSGFPPLHPGCRCYETWEIEGLNGD